jgi:hypothetical protein
MLLEELMVLSTNNQLNVAAESGNITQLYQPKLVIDAIFQVIEVFDS